MIMKLNASTLVLAAISHTAEAGEPAINIGAIEAIAVPNGQHLGAYPYAAMSVAVSVRRATLIPRLGIEYSPDTSRWGLVTTLVLDLPVSERLGIDLIASAIHDQEGTRLRDATFLLGGGVGVSVTTSRFVVSPSLCVYGSLDAGGWSVVPGVNISYAF
jgi:hypothetical protein